MLDADIAVDGKGWAGLGDVEALVDRALGAAASGCGLPLRRGAGVSVLLADDARIREINREWRGQDKPTNVLSFSALPPDRIRAEAARAPFLGDIALAFETLEREAAAEAKPLPHHLAHLVVHGFLHLVGHDHETEPEAAAMEALETRILAGLGIPDPYGATTAGSTAADAPSRGQDQTRP